MIELGLPLVEGGAHSHCHHCGSSLAQAFPHDGGTRCMQCAQVNYRNPTPVAVLIVPYGDGIIAVRRNIEPFRGRLSLPGGYILHGESWQRAAVREAHEEVGCVIRENPTEWPKHFATESTPDGSHVIIVGTARAFHLGAWTPNSEVSEVVGYDPRRTTEQLCFPIHQRAVADYFAQR